MVYMGVGRLGSRSLRLDGYRLGLKGRDAFVHIHVCVLLKKKLSLTLLQLLS